MDGLWYSFLDYLASPAGSDGAAMQELERRLRAIKEHLSARGAGPYLQGADISAQDMCLAPRLHHILTALPYLKVCAKAAGWTIPGPPATTCRAGQYQQEGKVSALQDRNVFRAAASELSPSHS